MMKTREDIFAQIKTNPKIPVLIIGAGVNGIGTFRDLSLQGVDVLLVDRGDFCSGASAASSHMIHGGIRYLENGEFRLVREAVQERNRLLVNAPHLVKPLSTIIPIFNIFSGLFNAPLKFLGLLDRPAERGAVVIKVGLTLYDFYARQQGTVPKHSIFSKQESIDQFPQINQDVKYTAKYFDGAMLSPERLCLELILDGEQANINSHALNYISAEGARNDSIELHDQLSGKILYVQPQIVINASGPWIDITNQNLGITTKFIGGTKGSHLIIDNPTLRDAIGENEFFFENKDGRIVLIFPLFDKVMIGTSDIPIDNPDQARCSQEEIQYFIDMVRVVFPGIKVDREQIIYQFTGVRPLPENNSSTAGQISRDHSIEIVEGENHNFPILNLIGGKWTSFRAFSEEVSNVTLRYLDKDRLVSTKDLPIGGGKNFPSDEKRLQTWLENQQSIHGLPIEQIKSLFERYGTRAENFIDFVSNGDDTPLEYLSTYSRKEILFIINVEKVLHLDDFLFRRTNLAKLGLLSRNLVEELSVIMSSELDWSEVRRSEEISRTLQILQEFHNVII